MFFSSWIFNFSLGSFLVSISSLKHSNLCSVDTPACKLEFSCPYLSSEEQFREFSKREGWGVNGTAGGEDQTSSWGWDKSKASQKFSPWVTAQHRSTGSMCRHSTVTAQLHLEPSTATTAGTKGPGLSLHESLCLGQGCAGGPRGSGCGNQGLSVHSGPWHAHLVTISIMFKSET